MYITSRCEVTDDMIDGLNLESLDACGNKSLTNFTKMQSYKFFEINQI